MTYIKTSKSIILYIFRKKMKYLTSIIISLLLFSCESDSLPAPEPIDPDDLSNATVWRGETKTLDRLTIDFYVLFLFLIKVIIS